MPARLPTLLLLFTFAACRPAGDADSASSDEPAEGTAEAAPTGDEAPQPEAESEAPAQVVLYSGRNEQMIGPIIEAFEDTTGIDVVVNYAGSAELAATILEEGEGGRADVFLAQDASTLGFLEQQGVLAELPAELTSSVPDEFRSPDGRWVGITGRARVLAYNTHELTPEQLPADLQALTEPAWRGRVGWAPENASFQSFVAAMVALEGEEATQEWLAAMQANEPVAFPSNTPMVTAIGRGEIAVGLTNHYYLYRLREEYGEDFAAANRYFRSGDAASFVNVTGAAVLGTSDNVERAHQLVEFMLQPSTQLMFVEANHEFPLVEGVASPDGLPDASELNHPDVDLAQLYDLETTHRLLRASGALR